MSQTRYVPRRGDFIWLDFNPQKGSEQAGRRPAVVLSTTEYNRQVGLAIVCSIMSATKGYPWEVTIPLGEFVAGVVLSDQIKNVDWRGRNAEFISTAAPELLEDVIQKAFALIDPEDDDAPSC